ncbi:MAG: hypothetical protein ACR2QA_18570 [Solirubrobacteraceae bacterium]
MLSSVFWPLIAGFVALVLIAVLLGWVMDPARHPEEPGDGHDGHEGH